MTHVPFSREPKTSAIEHKISYRTMPIVYIPSLLRDLTHGQETLAVPGNTVGQVVEALEQSYPGMKARLCEGDSLRPGLALIVDTEVSRQGLRHPLAERSEVHFLPQVSGGSYYSAGC